MHVLFEEAGRFLAGRVLSRGRIVGAGGARQRQAREGQKQPLAAAFRDQRKRHMVGRRACGGQRHRAGPGLEVRPTRSLASPTWPAILLPRPHRSSKPACCWPCSKRRTTSAALARGRFREASAEVLAQALAAIEKSAWWPRKEESPSGPANWPRAPAPRQLLSSCTKFCSSLERTEYKAVVDTLRAPPRPRRWRCCNRPAPSARPTSSH